MSAVRTALPVVDLRDEPAALRMHLRSVAHEVGFFHLTGHGVAEDLTCRVLAEARRLFALPQGDKSAVAMVNSPHFRGYTRLGGELTGGVVDWREQIDIGPQRSPLAEPAEPYLRLQGPNQWPAALPELPGIIAEWDAALTELGRRLLRHLAVSLGSPESVFDDAFADTPATLIKIVRYPARAGTPQGVGAHRDAGVLTLLFAEPGSHGLEVRLPTGASEARGNDTGASEARGNDTGAGEARGNDTGATGADQGEWIDVDPQPGAFIVNIGEMLEIASGGYLRATEHRVRLSSRERISVPYFFNPRLDAQMPVLTLSDELAAEARGVSIDPSNERIFSVYGRNAWKSRLRAHPDVAAAHGYGRAEPGG